MSSGLPYRVPAGKHHRIAFWPTTRLGTWAVSLAAASFLLNFAWRFMGPVGGAPSLALALVGGVLAFLAVVRRGERAISVYVALVPFLGAVVFLLAEVFVPH